MASDRQFFHAYLKLQQAHKLIHQALRAMEANSTDDEIKRLIQASTNALNSSQI